MPQTIINFVLVIAVSCGFAIAPVKAAEREQVRAVINLIAAVKMPYPEKLESNLSRTEWVRLELQWRNHRVHAHRRQTEMVLRACCRGGRTCRNVAHPQ